MNDAVEPVGLSERAVGLWKAVHAGYELSAAEAELLIEGCRALDRADEAAALIERDGLVVQDRYGSPKVHPAADVERSSRGFFAAVVKQLRIEKTVGSSGRSGAKPGPKAKPRALRSA